MRLVRIALIGLGGLLLGGCLIDIQPEPSVGSDTCGSGVVEPYLGGSVDLIPTDLIGQPARVYPTGSMLTMDYRTDRLNVEYDPDTREVLRVSCG